MQTSVYIVWKHGSICIFKNNNFFLLRIKKLYILNCFDVLILKIKKYYFNIFYIKNNYNHIPSKGSSAFELPRQKIKKIKKKCPLNPKTLQQIFGIFRLRCGTMAPQHK
jgi:hypothetical protein